MVNGSPFNDIVILTVLCLIHQQLILLSGVGLNGTDQPVSESEVWEVQYDSYTQSSGITSAPSTKILPVMVCSEDGILAVLEQVEQAKSGLKVDKGFKKTAYVAAASTVNAKFNTTFDAENVENHMRTLRAKYAEIKKCKEISRAGWNEELKMIILEGPTYATYVEAHPKAADVLNKPIKHYDALKIISGDDQATGQFCSTIYDNYINDSADGVNIAARNEMTPDNDGIEGRGLGQDGDAFTPTNNNDAIPSSGKSRGKRPREANDEHFDDLIATVKEVAIAIKISATAHWSDNLWPRIVEAGGYSSEVYDTAYSFLYDDEKQGRLFMSKPTESRRAWLDRFVEDNFSRFTDYL
uniref:Myb/SANT-like domain-containing protein n=1 Tax=Ananas comosus var. bracteatus TaxID=296719 RepID=A0A6V7QCX2_ANACO|nr:unnamed protein product [Ananas comosus var. bracteatus]